MFESSDHTQSLALLDNPLICATSAIRSQGTADLDTARVVTIPADENDGGVYIPPNFTRWVQKKGGNTTNALVLSQCLYWYKKSKEGKPRLSLRAKGDTAIWLVKRYAELASEAGVTEKMAKDTITWAVENGIVYRELHGFGGKKTAYIRFVCARGAAVTSAEEVMNYAYPTIQTHGSFTYGPMGTLPTPHTDLWVPPNTETTLSETTGTETKTYKQASGKTPAKDATPEAFQAKPGEAKPSIGKTTPPVPVETAPEGEKPKKPTPDAPPIPDQWLHYAELAKVYDMDTLLTACTKARFLAEDRTMFSEDECRYLWPLHLEWKKNVDDGDLDNLFKALTDTKYSGERWSDFCAAVASAKPKVKAIPWETPKLAFLKKHLHVLYEVGAQVKELTPQATQQPATPMATPDEGTGSLAPVEAVTEPEMTEPEPEAPAEIPAEPEAPAEPESFDWSEIYRPEPTPEEQAAAAAEWRQQQAERAAAAAAAEAVEKASKATKTGKVQAPKPHHLFIPYD